jgi:hypothetical protein
VKVGEKTPTQLGPLERVNLNHWFCTFDILTYVYLLEKIHIVWLKNKIILALKMPLIISIKFILAVESFAVK